MEIPIGENTLASRAFPLGRVDANKIIASAAVRAAYGYSSKEPDPEFQRLSRESARRWRVGKEALANPRAFFCLLN